MTRTVHRSLAQLVATALLPALAACGTAADTMAPVPPATGDYHLGAGDQLKITTFGEPALTGEIRVDDAGHIALPLAGDVAASGKTPTELGAGIADLLKRSKLYRDPKVSVEVIGYRPIFILGEVAKPGQYPYEPGMTALTAVAIAGGFTYRAVTDRFSVVRTLPKGAIEGRASRETPLSPNDVLTVYERVL